MLDAGSWQAHTRGFLDALLREGGTRPSAVVYTHSHWDHVLGGVEVGGVVIAQALTAEGLIELAERDWSDDSSVMYVEPDGVLFLGDCVSASPAGTMTAESAFRLCDVILGFGATHYVEGHHESVSSRGEMEGLFEKVLLAERAVREGFEIAVVEGQERLMRQWDSLHSPPGTAHITVGAGAAPCAILMFGSPDPNRNVSWIADEVAAKYSASVACTTGDARETYEDLPAAAAVRAPTPSIPAPRALRWPVSSAFRRPASCARIGLAPPPLLVVVTGCRHRKEHGCRSAGGAAPTASHRSGRDQRTALRHAWDSRH